MGLGWTLLLLASVGSANVCLPDGIPENDRAFLQSATGELEVVKLLAFDWASAELVSIIARIVIEEARPECLSGFFCSLCTPCWTFSCCYLTILDRLYLKELPCVVPDPKPLRDPKPKGPGVQSGHQ